MDRNTMNHPTRVMALVVGDTVMGLVAEDSVMGQMAQHSVVRLPVEDSGMDFDEAHVRDLGFGDSDTDSEEDSGTDSEEDSDIPMTEDSGMHSDEDSDIPTVEDSDINPTTGNSDIDIARGFFVAFPPGFFIITAGEIIDLISDPRMGIDEVFRYFPKYEPRFRGEPHLNHLHRFVCENPCFLRNWLFVQDMLFRRFWAQFCQKEYADSLDEDAVGALGEIICFFAFATIPFDTRRLPNNDWIGNYGRLLRPDLKTFLLVWQFYDGPLRYELGDLARVRSISEDAQQIVANVSLGGELQPAANIEHLEAAICFNADNQIHVREVQRSWMNFRNNVDERLEQLGPWRGCCGMEERKMLTVLPKEYFPPDIDLGNNTIEPPQIRRYSWGDGQAPPLVSHDWWDTAAHHHNFLANAQERSRPVSREEPEPPRQLSYGNEIL